MNKINPLEVFLVVFATVLTAWGMVSLVYKWLDHSETEFKTVAVQHQADNSPQSPATPDYTYIAPADKAVIEMRKRE